MVHPPPPRAHDSKGNLWAVVRRQVENEDRIVIVREGRQYQSMSAANDLRRLESELGRLRKTIAVTETDLHDAAGAKNPLRVERLTNGLKTYRDNESDLQKAIEELRASQAEKDVREWTLPCNLQGVVMLVEG